MTMLGKDLFENLHSDPVILPPTKDDTYRRILVNFMTEEDVQKYATLLQRSITAKTKELWFPDKSEALKTLFEWDSGGSYEPINKKTKEKEYSLDGDLWDSTVDKSFYELHWQNMPEFNQPDSSAVRKILHIFQTEEEVTTFAKLVNQKITKQTSSIWFPYRQKNDVKDLYWISV